MAILNFPESPSTNDTYTGDNGVTYTFDGVKWIGATSGGSGANLGHLYVDVDNNTIVSQDSAAYVNFDAESGNDVLGLGTNNGAVVKISTMGGANPFILDSDNGGSLTFPDGSTQTTAYDGTAVGLGNLSINGTGIYSRAGDNIGWNNGVISLFPGSAENSDYASNGQYINIYPTNAYDAPHIHIAAGQDNGGGDLLLGGDYHHVDINHDGNVYIRTNTQSNQWTFNADGNLQLPAGGDIVDSNGSSVLITPSGVSFPLTRDDYNSPNMLQATEGDSNWNIGFYSDGMAQFYTQAGFFGDGSSTRGFRILDNDSGNAWIFDGRGNLSMPSNTFLSTPDASSLTLRTSGSQGATNIEYVNDIEGALPYNSKLTIDLSGAAIHAAGDTLVWRFNSSGNLVLPYNGRIVASDIADEVVIAALTDSGPQKSGVWFGRDNDDGTQQYVQVIAADSDGRQAEVNVWADGPDYNAVEIKADNKTWEFKSDGSVRFPDNTVQTTAYNYSPQPLVNLDGGTAGTSFPTNYVYVDCGGSYIRGILQEDTFDGQDGGAYTTEFDKVLNGGGA